MNSFRSLILFTVVTLISTSCDKDEEVICNQAAVSDSKSVLLDFSMNAGEETFIYDTVYEFNGVAVEFSELRFYLSDIMLYDDAENTEEIDQTILLDAGSADNTFTLGETEFTHIQELHVLFGLNETVNHEDPTQAEAPLNDAAMHWGWAPESGYKFLKAEFTVDTDGDNIPDAAGSIHCAMDAVSREITLGVNQDVDGDDAHLMIDVDVISFFSEVDFLNLTGTHGSSPLTNSVADNVSSAFVIN